MAKGPVLKPIFKRYDQRQPMLLPPSVDELIAANHPVRVVDEVLGRVNIDPLIRKYATGGASNYHPLMLLKVLVYAYMNNIYSSRKIEEALQQNIHFMWLSAMSTPDHNTINRFRSSKGLAEEFKTIFTQVVELLAAEGLLSIKELYTDGTKIEANANRYTFVWGNAIKTSKERMKLQLEALWNYAKNIAASELDDDNDPNGFKKIEKEKVKQTISNINEALKDKPADRKITQKLKYAEKNFPAAIDRYEAQEKIIGEGRNSYSKSDTDATFMRMKEDHMLNGQLKAAYNLQISTNNQFIANYTIHQATTDTTTLKEHLLDTAEQLGSMPQSVTADAGYGSEENYKFLEENNIEAFVKYGLFDRDQNNNIQKSSPFTADKLHYNEKEDYYVCPMGQHMQNAGSYSRETSTGYIQKVTKYQAHNCAGCPLNGVCHKSKGNRIIEINKELLRLKAKAKQKLLSEQGIKKRKQRCCDVEPVFGNIKNNHGFKRFMLRGKKKVTVEIGLVALAHNLRKKAA